VIFGRKVVHVVLFLAKKSSTCSTKLEFPDERRVGQTLLQNNMCTLH